MWYILIISSLTWNHSLWVRVFQLIQNPSHVRPSDTLSLLPFMVGFNVHLPQIRISWVGSLTWRIVLTTLIDVGPIRLWEAPCGSTTDKEAMSEGRLHPVHPLAFHPVIKCFGLLLLLQLLPFLIAEHLLRCQVLNLHHGRRASSPPGNFQASGARSEIMETSYAVDWVVTDSHPSWQTVIMWLV